MSDPTRDPDTGEYLCDISGLCVASADAVGITSCIYCGKELIQREDGNWYTWDAEDLCGPGGGKPQAVE